MNNYSYYFGILILAELWLVLIFRLVARVFKQDMEINLRSFFKGIVERFFLAFALINDYPHALTLFSALKLGTRLKHQDDSSVGYNDFYLVGNLISVSTAIGYVLLFKFMMRF
jgi:hypothetical protein